MTTPLALHDVDVVLGGQPVLRRVDLRVGAGEFVALLGANGSGKSTIVRAAVGLVPFTGSIRLFDTPLDRFGDRHRLGYVPQKAAAAAGVPATVREVVASGRLSRRRFVGLPTRADREAAARAIEAVGLTHRSRSPLVELSGGQQQRVHIARALAAEPELVIMDEPTAGVDQENTELLARSLGDLAREGTAILLVAHELGPMRPLIDRAVVMQSGEVAYDGPVDGLRAEEHHGHAHPHSGEPGRLEPLPGQGVW